MEKIPGLLLFVEFEKAFDSIEWSFIEKTLTLEHLWQAGLNFFIRT